MKMKRILLFLAILLPAFGSINAQTSSRAFYFVDDKGQPINDGATVQVNQEEEDITGKNVMMPEVFVETKGDPRRALMMKYTISRIGAGELQVCFPSSCIIKDAVGSYETEASEFSLIGQTRRLFEVEYYPAAKERCVVKAELYTVKKQGGADVADELCATLNLVFDNTVTGIAAIADRQAEQCTVYNLEGHIVGTSTTALQGLKKGVYILKKSRNGKTTSVQKHVIR